jgi:8-oxo-dGTP diphosphatase
VAALDPLDERERTDQAIVLAWIESRAPLYRTDPPDEPPKHLVAYFLPYDTATDHVFLIGDRKAGRTLPPGGHVEADEQMWAAVVREFAEELGGAARAHPSGSSEAPIFLTVTQAVGPHTHTDVSLWFLLDLEATASLHPDPGEFFAWGWYPRAQVVTWPSARTDPELSRFLTKGRTVDVE